MAFVKSNKSQKQLLISYLHGTNRGISAAQADAIFGIKNLRARMTELKQEGFVVYKDVNTRGNTTYFVSDKKLKVV